MDLAITKTDGRTTYVPGAVITYTLEVTNAGPSTATGFSISDTVPAALTGVTATCVVQGLGSCGSNGSAGNNVSFTNATLAPGGGNALSIAITGTVSPATTGPLANTATVTAGAGTTEANLANNSATDTDSQGAGLANLAITKTNGQSSYVAGAPVTYTLTITNAGPSHAPAFDVSDLVPAAIAGVSVSCTPSGTASCGTNGSTGNGVAFTGASLNAGAGNSLTITISGTISPDADGPLANTAQLTVPAGAGYTDPAPGNNTATDTDTAQPQQVDLAITKTDGQTSYVPGAPIRYTLVVTNAGPSTATDVRVTDAVPAAITGVTAHCVAAGLARCGTTSAPGNSVSVTNASLPPGVGNHLTAHDRRHRQPRHDRRPRQHRHGDGGGGRDRHRAREQHGHRHRHARRRRGRPPGEQDRRDSGLHAGPAHHLPDRGHQRRPVARRRLRHRRRRPGGDYGGGGELCGDERARAPAGPTTPPATRSPSAASPSPRAAP